MPPTQRKVLLLVSGMSPQIITETLYALTQAKEPWVPDEVHLITTLQGRDNAVLQLLQDRKRFAKFLSDYKIAHPIHFNESTIHLIRDDTGQPLADLRTPEDNEAAADTICDIVRRFTQDEASELHVSLAGGRKTMGFYAGYALSLFGRPQDSLSHVLVSEHYESNKDFFYPTPTTHVIFDRDNNPLDASKAQVWLAKIPFVRLRSGLPESLLGGQHGFSETVALARKVTEKARLVLFPSDRVYELNGVSGKLTPVLMAILLWAARRTTPIAPVVDGEKNSDYAKELVNLADDYNLILHGRTEANLYKGDVSKSFLETNISKLNSRLASQLGLELSALCKLAIVQRNDCSGYALPENLEIEIR